MKSFIVKDFKRRQRIIKYDILRNFLKAFQSNRLLPDTYRIAASKQLHRLKFYSISKVKNRCQFTYRGRAVYHEFKSSRHKLRELASFGRFVGVQKSTW